MSTVTHQQDPALTTAGPPPRMWTRDFVLSFAINFFVSIVF
ncbi:hypothetical protein [Luteococcus peritonei]|uniref:MFS transporter n=1 Tax=Luteococcus peritonei TaxID=88874 RepID=A0ABW4RYC0_9ACTN